MPEGFSDPDVISAAIKVLAWTSATVGAALAALGTALVGTIVFIWKKTDAKVDRIATCLESLERTVSTDVATLKGQIITIERVCAERHPEDRGGNVKKVSSIVVAITALFFFSVSTSSAGFADFNFGNWSIGGNGSAGSTPVFYAPLTSSLTLSMGSGSLTFTRASEQWYRDDNSVFQTASSGNPAFNSKGIFLEPASTNKITGYSVIPADSYGSTRTSGNLVVGRKYEIVTTTADYFGAGKVVGDQFSAASALALSAPNSVKEIVLAVGTIATAASTTAVTGMTLSGAAAATLSVVDDTSALAAVGLQNIASTGKVYKLDNSGGATQAFATAGGTTGNTNVHSCSMYIRGGTGAVYFVGTAITTFTASGTYTVRKSENASPSAGTNTLSIRAEAGQTLYFILPQLEESTFATSPIVTVGATATRAITALSFPVAGNMTTNAVSGTFEWTPSMTNPSARWLWGSYQDASNYTGVYRDGTTGQMVFRKRIAGVNNDATLTVAVTPGTTYRVGWRIGPAGMDVFLNGAKGTTNANSTNAVLGTTVQIGADGNGANMGTPQIRNFRIYYGSLADNQL